MYADTRIRVILAPAQRAAACHFLPLELQGDRTLCIHRRKFRRFMPALGLPAGGGHKGRLEVQYSQTRIQCQGKHATKGWSDVPLDGMMSYFSPCRPFHHARRITQDPPSPPGCALVSSVRFFCRQ